MVAEWIGSGCQLLTPAVEELYAEEADKEAADMRLPGDTIGSARREADDTGDKVDHHPDDKKRHDRA